MSDNSVTFVMLARVVFNAVYSLVTAFLLESVSWTLGEVLIYQDPVMFRE